jgi:hypothetical protein
MNTSKIEKLKVHVEAVNLCNSYYNKFVPLMRKFFGPYVGQKILKADNRLLSKIKLPDFPEHDPRLDICQSTSEYMLSWKIRVGLPYSNTYFYTEVQCYIGNISKGVLKELTNDVSPRCSDYKAEDIIDKIVIYEEIEKMLQTAKNSLYPFTDYVV